MFLESNTAGQANYLELKNGTGTGAYFGLGGTGLGLTDNNDLVIGNRGSGDITFNVNGGATSYINTNGEMGIGMYPLTNFRLSVSGNAYKLFGGSWVSSSDKRLKKNIEPISAEKMLESLLAIQGVTYEWADTTGRPRPDGVQYGFIAQNIQEVFPHLVTVDDYGFLQTPYGTYDAMTVEAIRALNDKIERLEKENETLKTQVAKIDKLEAMLLEIQRSEKEIDLGDK